MAAEGRPRGAGPGARGGGVSRVGVPRLRPRWVVLALAALVFGSCGRADPPAPPARPAAPSSAGEERARFFEVVRDAERAWKQERNDEAERLYGDALAAKPDHEPSLVAMAALRKAAGDRDGALAWLVKYRERRPEVHRPSMLIGDFLSETGPEAEPDLEAAFAAYQEASRKNLEDTGPFLRQARVQRLLGRSEDAIDAYTKVLGTHPGSREALLGLAEIHLARGDAAAAVPLLVRALDAGTKAAGRADVPSEMDTRASFRAHALEDAANVQAYVALAHAARNLGGYPDAVPDRLRLDDLARLAPPGEILTLSSGGGRSGVAAIHAEGPEVVVVPGLPSAGHPIVVRGDASGEIRAGGLERLAPAASAGLADVDLDGELDLVLGGARARERTALRFVPSVLAEKPGAERRLELQGVVLGQTARAVFVAGRIGSERPGLHRVGAGGRGEVPVTRLADGIFLAVAADGDDVLALEAGGRVIRGGGATSAKPVASVAGVDGERAPAAIALTDVDGDGQRDLVVGLAAPLPEHLRFVVSGTASGSPTLVVFLGRAEGGFAEDARIIPGIPPLPIRSLVAMPTSGRLVAALGIDQPALLSAIAVIDVAPALVSSTTRLVGGAIEDGGAIQVLAPRGAGGVVVVGSGPAPGSRCAVHLYRGL